MTRTEERLADALRASAGQVRDDRLRRLIGAGRAELAPSRRQGHAWPGEAGWRRSPPR